MAYTPVDKSDDYFNTKLYTGNGYPTSGTQSITGVGFQPDLIWIKDRDTSGNSHIWTDSVRGNTKNIFSNLTNAESTKTDRVTSFDSDGFSLGADASQGVNDNGSSQVSWNWLAANGTASNTDGSITSTVSANTTSGFSIVSFTGTGSAATVGHGLGKEVDWIIIKNRNDSVLWSGYHRSVGATKYISINSSGAAATSSGMWNNTDPTSSVFSVGASNNTNDSGDGMIAYCFASIKGFSKFNKYTGNGSTNGPFVYTGFKPAWLMVKRTDSTNNWLMMDNKRNSANPMGEELKADESSAGNTATRWDFLSNGFKLRNGGAAVNGSGASYIYMAFAENPFVTSTGIPACAR